MENRLRQSGAIESSLAGGGGGGGYWELSQGGEVGGETAAGRWKASWCPWFTGQKGGAWSTSTMKDDLKAKQDLKSAHPVSLLFCIDKTSCCIGGSQKL